jgi:hypothetical protein
MQPAGLTRFILSGTSPEGEIFQTGFYELLTNPVTTQAEAQTVVNQMRDQFQDTDTGAADILATILPTTAAYKEVTGYFYSGASPTAAFVAVAAVDPARGTGTGAGSLPLQTCMVVTLLTGAAGRRNRGRMYIPAYGAVIAANEFTAEIGTILNGIKNWWNAAQGSGVDGRFVVYSSVGSTVRNITSLRVDSRPDIQRRRANTQTVTSVVTGDLALT